MKREELKETKREELKGTKREKLKEQIDELMGQYANEEIDGNTYTKKIMELTSSARNEKDKE